MNTHFAFLISITLISCSSLRSNDNRSSVKDSLVTVWDILEKDNIIFGVSNLSNKVVSKSNGFLYLSLVEEWGIIHVQHKDAYFDCNSEMYDSIFVNNQKYCIPLLFENSYPLNFHYDLDMPTGNAKGVIYHTCYGAEEYIILSAIRGCLGNIKDGEVYWFIIDITKKNDNSLFVVKNNIYYPSFIADRDKNGRLEYLDWHFPKSGKEMDTCYFYEIGEREIKKTNNYLILERSIKQQSREYDREIMPYEEVIKRY